MGIPKKIWQAPLFKATSLNGIGVLVKIAIGFATSKVIAIFVGPSGMALAGNLRNFLTSLEGVATLGFQNGIVKYVAESKTSESELKRTISTVFLSLFAVMAVCCVLLFALSDFWSAWVFNGNRTFADIFKIMALALPFYALSLVSIAVLNGLGNYRNVIWANIIGNVIGLAISVGLIVKYSLFGALLAIVLSPSVLFFVSIFYVSREIGIFSNISPTSFDGILLKRLGAYSLMTLFSAVCVPLVYLKIRQEAIAFSGIDAAGHWEAINRISSYYMLFVSTLVSVYFLPKLVLATKPSEVKAIFISYFKAVMPLFILGTVLLYFLRSFAVGVLFTQDFKPVENLFFFQLLGDVLRSASMILGCCFIAKKMTKSFFVTEIFSLAFLYATSHFLLKVKGIEGLVAAHALTYLVYLIVLIGYFRKVLVSSEAS